jgi:hypothetical protein
MDGGIEGGNGEVQEHIGSVQTHIADSQPLSSEIFPPAPSALVNPSATSLNDPEIV